MANSELQHLETCENRDEKLADFDRRLIVPDDVVVSIVFENTGEFFCMGRSGKIYRFDGSELMHRERPEVWASLSANARIATNEEIAAQPAWTRPFLNSARAYLQ